MRKASCFALVISAVLAIGMSLAAGTGVSAAQAMCILPYDPAGSYKTKDSPCTAANSSTMGNATETVAPYDSTKTLINFSWPLGRPVSFAVVFDNAASPVALATYDAQIKYNITQTDFTSPTCVWNIATPSAGDFNPNGYFENILQHVCGTGTPPQIYGAGGSLGNGNWPTPRPKGVELMKWTFGTLNYNPASPPAATPTLVFTKAKASDQDGGGVPLTVTAMNADVIFTEESPPEPMVTPPTSITVISGSPACVGTPPSGTMSGIKINYTMPAASTACKTSFVYGPCPAGCNPVAIIKIGGTAVAPKGPSPATDSTARPTGTPITYTAYGTCSGMGAGDDSVGLAAAPFTPACSRPPMFVSACKNGSTDCSTEDSGSAMKGAYVDLNVSISDDDSSGSQLTLNLFYSMGGSFPGGSATATVLNTSGPITNFKATIPGAAMNRDDSSDVFFYFVVTDNTNLKTIAPSQCTSTPCSTDNSYRIKNSNIVSYVYPYGFKDFRFPTPNQVPFRAGSGNLVVAFAINDPSDVTMRIYTPDGRVVRELQNSSLDPFTSPNICNWQKGCSWDGTSNDSGGGLVENGLYMVNLFARAIDVTKPSYRQTINSTKGVVVMK